MFGFGRETSSENLAFFLVLDFVGGGLSGFRAGDVSFSVFWVFFLYFLPAAAFPDGHLAPLFCAERS